MFNNKKYEKILKEKKPEVDELCEQFAEKFGILKKASVLYFYGRFNDAFDVIAKACEIIKREKDQAVQKYWANKLGLPEGLELGKPYDQVTPEDITEQFMKKIEANNADIASIKIYLQKTCPQVRNQFDRNTFLNGLIEDLYFKCEDIMIDKQENINKIKKNVEKLNEVQEILEAMGPDADKDPNAFEDADGNKIRYKRKVTTMCDNIYVHKKYKQEEIPKYKDKKTGNEKFKHYVEVNTEKKFK